MSLARCPECGKLISLRFPVHDCTPPKKKAEPKKVKRRPRRKA